MVVAKLLINLIVLKFQKYLFKNYKISRQLTNKIKFAVIVIAKLFNYQIILMIQ